MNKEDSEVREGYNIGFTLTSLPRCSPRSLCSHPVLGKRGRTYQVYRVNVLVHLNEHVPATKTSKFRVRARLRARARTRAKIRLGSSGNSRSGARPNHPLDFLRCRKFISVPLRPGLNR